MCRIWSWLAAVRRRRGCRRSTSVTEMMMMVGWWWWWWWVVMNAGIAVRISYGISPSSSSFWKTPRHHPIHSHFSYSVGSATTASASASATPSFAATNPYHVESTW